MKKIILVLIFISTLAVIGRTSGYSSKVEESRGSNPIDSIQCRAADFPKQDLSKAEETDLIYMREEEKLAHDFYSLMFDKWGLRPFHNIKGSEERHMSAMKSLINKYNLTDPVRDSKNGVFTNGELEKIYIALIQQGNQSELDALKAGAEIEELDIKDLMSAIKNTDNDDLKFVYNNLMRASGNHLRAFMRNINRRGGTYNPSHLDKKSFEDILNNSCEK